MINIFISRRHTYTLKPFLNTWPNRATGAIRLVSYQNLYRIQSVSPGLFIFSDVDRLTAQQRSMAERLCAIISGNGGNPIFNHPGKVLSRRQLLLSLWEQGANSFRIYSIGAHEEPTRYPVFFRRANDHFGALTGLIANKENYDRQVRALLASGEDPAELIAVEFCDTCQSDGLFRKYSAFRIGEAIVPAHIIFSRDWVTKDMPPEPLRDEEKRYLEDNPHRDELMRIFRLANIDYGRIDYGMLEGKIQVWEINTNPLVIQKREKYSEDKRELKQKLVDQLADAFLQEASRAAAMDLKNQYLAVDVLPRSVLTLPRAMARWVLPIKI